MYVNAGKLNITRTQLSLRWPRNVAKVEYSLSSVEWEVPLFNDHFSVISENITINHILSKTRFFGLLTVAESMGLTSIAMT